MKKALLFILFFAFTSVVAQNQDLSVPKADLKKATMKPMEVKTGLETMEAKQAAQTPLKSADGDAAGITYYDWMTNNSNQRRLLLEDDGTLHAVWTYGLSADAFDDRGTGYNVRVDGTWNDAPQERLESQRTGWPSIGKTASGRTFAVSHTSAEGLSFVYKDDGEDDWTTQVIQGDAGAVWPRAAVDGDNIYVIVSRADGTFGDLPNGLAFHRSLDGGDTWEGPFELPLNDYYGGVTVDCYDIDAHNGKVAFVLGGFARQVVLFSSEDNGDNWEPTVIAATDNPTIVDGSATVDYFEPTSLADNVSLVLDDDGNAHFAGAWIFISEVNGPAQPGFFLTHSGITYWTEGMDKMELIGNAFHQDWNGDGSDSISLTTDGWQFYSNTSLGQPTIAVDEDSNPYIAYSTTLDSDFDGTFYRREIMIVKGGEDGWEGPYNVSNDEESEDAFPHLPRRVLNGEVNVMYMADEEPGTALQEDHTWLENTMLVNTFSADDIVTPDYVAENNPPHLELFWATQATSQGCPLEAADIPGILAWDFPDGELTQDIVFPEIDFDIPSADQTNGDLLEFTVTDADGNTVASEMNFIVIEDVDAPEITLLCADGSEGCETIVVEVVASGTYEDAGYLFFDDSQINGCPGVENNVVVEGIEDVDLTTEGTYVITFTATDFADNESVIERTITVIGEDAEGPVLELVFSENLEDNGDGTYSYEGDPSEDEISISTTDDDADIYIVATDNVSTNVEPVISGDVPNPGILDTYEITITAIDDADNETVETFTIIVEDTTAPELDLQAGQDANQESCIEDQNGALVNLSIFDIEDAFDDGVELSFDASNVDFTMPAGDPGVPYTVDYIATDASGNSSDPYTINYFVAFCWATGIEDIALANAIQVSPNPSNGLVKLTIDGNYATANVAVMNIQGKEILNIENVFGTTELNLTEVSAGVYFVKVSTDNAVALKKIVVE